MNHSPEINKLLQEYALRPEIQQQGGVSSAAYRGLEHMLATSPMLERMLQEAASLYTNAQGQPLLRHLDVLSAGNSSGAEYKEGTLYLSPASLAKVPHKEQEMNRQVFLTAHEIQHSFQADRLQQARESVSTEIGHIARSPAAVHDYTLPLQRLQAADANDEARAALAGWNLMVGHMRHVGLPITLADLAETPHGHYFIQKNDDGTFHFKAGLTPRPDMMLEFTPANVQAMEQHYFYADPIDSKIGPRRNSDYANAYAAEAIGLIAHEEMAQQRHGPPPKVVIDMGRLRLDEALLEQYGLDLGGPGRQLRYEDAARPGIARGFDHTSSGAQQHQHVPNPALQPGPAVDVIKELYKASQIPMPQGLERLSHLVQQARPDFLPQQNADATLYLAHRMQCQGLPLGGVAEVQAADYRQRPMLGAIGDEAHCDPVSRSPQLVVADVTKALQTPAQQSLQAMEQEQAQAQQALALAPQQGHGPVMTM